jgi:hypothetical protein
MMNVEQYHSEILSAVTINNLPAYSLNDMLHDVLVPKTQVVRFTDLVKKLPLV